MLMFETGCDSASRDARNFSVSVNYSDRRARHFHIQHASVAEKNFEIHGTRKSAYPFKHAVFKNFT